MIRKVFLLIFFSILFTGLAPGAVFSASLNCSECHHVDFQTELINRQAVCTVCHDGHTTWNSPNSINADFDTIHITTYHKGGSHSPTTERKTGCWVCHYTDLTTTVRRVWCKTCHTNVPHENHGNRNATDWATNGRTGVAGDDNGYIQRTFSCIDSNCHSNYGSLVKKPSCFNCHNDPHGAPMGPHDEAGVKVNPNAANPTSNSDISIKWLYQAGDSLQKSLDGINWTGLDIGTPQPGNYYTYTDVGILNWTIVYYKIIRGGGDEWCFPVFPPGTNAHINYLDNTQLCASCHITHSAEQAKLLKERTIEDLCRTCHGLANTGSRYNVDTGEIVVAGSIGENGLITATSYIRSNSGAFGILSDGKYYAGNHSETWNGAEVTSSHSTSSVSSYIAPGGGHNRITLTCTNCHSSHPKKNAYRLLKISNAEAYAVNPSATYERINYIQKMNTGCGCHKQYLVGPNSGHVSENTYFRHSVGAAIRGSYASINPVTDAPWNLTTTLPTEYMVYHSGQYRVAGTLTGSAPVQFVENGAVFCLTCHYAHGTTAVGSSPSAYDLNEDSVLNDFSTMLKRKNYDATCQDCHKK